jgi:hypothetical protein
MKVVTIAVAGLALCACSEHRPPAPTNEQSAQLNDAEAMLDEAANNASAAPPSSRR